MNIITKASDAKPGYLYAEVDIVEDGEGHTYDTYGRLLWRGGDGKWYDAETVDDDYEYREVLSYAARWVEQLGAFHPDYAYLSANP